MSKFYIPSLDGLRAIAVLLVITFHFSKVSFIDFDFEIGWVGVQIFFVLSGYLITRILLEEKRKNFGSYIKTFYWKRLLRIFPLYFGYLIAILMLFLATGQPDDLPQNAPYLFTYTYNFFIISPEWTVNRLFVHLWSLSVEEQFYLIWPFVVFFLSERNFKKVIACMLVGIPLLRLVIAISFADIAPTEDRLGNIVYWFSLSHFDAFALGGFINFLGKQYLGAHKKQWIWGSLALCVVLGLINLFTAYPLNTNSYSSLGYLIHGLLNYQHVWSYTILNIFFAAIIWQLTTSQKKSLLTSRPLLLIGKVSYGMYLFHFPVIMAIDKGLGKPFVNGIVTLLLCLTVTFIVSIISYYAYERQFLKLKNIKSF
ncbi:acyltransferase family protein [Fulvivirga sediminis]|uniref:Acyltransferase n=1 Tax=Fulvivirga sediminis TaxID=2803949 RepID=A0A937K250_9BACT|nr:acyltransferase [Fulvivirga sediminis]MBL3658196.1 acyltransferase [Fulvivirga sediminis]